MESPLTIGRERVAVTHHTFIRRVYGWMAAGLALTALTALLTISSEPLLRLVFGNRLVFYALVIGELGLVVALSAAINRLSAATATLLFLLYSALSGVTFSAIFLAYTQSSIATTFLVTAGTFGAMSAYGTLTRRDLTSWGSFLFMGLIGIVLASLVNLFFKSPLVYWVSTYCGIIVFVGLTAYDTQKLKAMAQYGFADGDAERKGAIVGALQLYLDFVNLFLMLLRLFGRRR
ncbi:membrane protein [Geotalea uraniireducens]|uniref:Membrane protein n=1 Tax=Geotalea uraniireducens TaxID=351604 RepID=A0ABM8ER12_9BACT|nr:Bax inhibitor-1/YccA family protein [Geotalea uraniireducens]BDV44727.1 membrane protein [Geotalea uraniireducens]